MEIKKIAQIARIYLNETEINSVEKKIEAVYRWLEDIKKIDVSGLEPLFNINENAFTVREFENPEFYSPSVILKNAPVKADDFILVPKVVEK